jgi:hypothetical protein
MKNDATDTTNNITTRTGKILLIRRSINFFNEKLPASNLLTMLGIIKYPDMTKNTSTPVYPPETAASPQ